MKDKDAIDGWEGRRGTGLRTALLLLLLAGVAVLARGLGAEGWIAGLRGEVAALGAWGPAVFALLLALSALLLLPAAPLALAAGALFGPWLGVLAATLGANAGAALAFLAARHLARGTVAAWLSRREKLLRVDDLVARHGALAVAITRLVPLFPFNLLNIAFGISRVPFRTYLLWSFLGMLPGTVLYVAGSAALAEAVATGRAPVALLAVAAACAVLPALLVCRLRRRLGEERRGEPRAARAPDRVVVLTRYPEAGRVKTRLIPLLGAQGAAALHRRLAGSAVDRLRRLVASEALVAQIALEVRYRGGDGRRMRAWLGEGVDLVPQAEGDLGARMAAVFTDAFADGAEKVVLVGSDIPELTGEHAREALAALDSHDLALGPAEDGGYWLIGLRREAWGRAEGALFLDPAWASRWGGGEVSDAALEAARQAGLSFSLLDRLADLDRPGDLARPDENGLGLKLDRGQVSNRREQAFRDLTSVLPLISVVIPALNEEEIIPAALDALPPMPGQEVIVADGGSRDRTASIARERGARVVEGPAGRAAQMNAGAAAARGEILLFLHADSRLPAGWQGMVRDGLADPAAGAGAFAFATDWEHPAMRMVAALANARARLLGVFYSDQALFVRASLFTGVGGFPDQPLMEDYELVRRLRRRARVVLLPAPAVTSARRWRSLGILRTALLHNLVLGGYLAGVSPARLARWFARSTRTRRGTAPTSR